jgi:ribonuclease HI
MGSFLVIDVLSRGLSKLVEQGKLDLIKGTRNSFVPSHTLYADDIMIFCKGKLSNINALLSLFNQYSSISGQHINASKSTIYAGSISQARLAHLVQLLGFQVGSLPFIYLGVPIFKGKPKSSHLQPILDRVKIKLASWKASLLSIAGRVQLVKSVVYGMILHIIQIYSWPVSLIKDLERMIRNFIWSGDITKRKLVAVAWSKICKPANKGGLGLRSISSLNKGANLKLCWDMMNSNEDWAVLLKDRVLRKKKTITHHIFSSLWSSIKHVYPDLLFNSSWVLGDGANINFWIDSWCGDSIASLLHIPESLQVGLKATVKDFIVEGRWHFPNELLQLFPNLLQLVSHSVIPLEPKPDMLIWKSSSSGDLSFKEAYLFYVEPGNQLSWAKTIWSIDIPPTKSLLVWRLMHGKIPSDENLMIRGCNLASQCSLCCKQSESSWHLFFECDFAVQIWMWFSSIININCTFNSPYDIWSICDRGWSPQCKIVILSALICIINGIWYCRNQVRFQNRRISKHSIISSISSATYLSGTYTKKFSYNSMRDFLILKAFNICIHPSKAPMIREVLWQPPLLDWIKCNTDGAAHGSPGLSACGGIFRNSSSLCVGWFAENLGIHNAFYAELVGAMKAIELAAAHNWHNLWLETDSKLVVLAFKNSSIIPWQLSNRWSNCLVLISHMNFVVSHIFREGNQSADAIANIGLLSLEPLWNVVLPSQVREIFVRELLGFPNFRFSS